MENLPIASILNYCRLEVISVKSLADPFLFPFLFIGTVLPILLSGKSIIIKQYTQNIIITNQGLTSFILQSVCHLLKRTKILGYPTILTKCYGTWLGGVSKFKIDGKGIYLSRLGVDKNYQKSGVGKKLILEILLLLEQEGLEVPLWEIFEQEAPVVKKK